MVTCSQPTSPETSWSSRERSARAEGLDNVETRVVDGEHLDVPPGTFDAIISRVGFIYFPDQHAAFVGMRQALRAGGRVAGIVYSTPEANGFFSIPVSIIRRRAQLPAPAPGQPGPFSLGATRCAGRRSRRRCRRGSASLICAPMLCPAPWRRVRSRRSCRRPGISRSAGPCPGRRSPETTSMPTKLIAVSADVRPVRADGDRASAAAFAADSAAATQVPSCAEGHSRDWKAQIAYLARHFRVVTFDPRGNGRSDRPHDPAQYAEAEFAADAVAVMDATDTERAVIVGFSRGAQRALLLAAEHPERVRAVAFIGPWFPTSRLGGLRWRIMATSAHAHDDVPAAAHGALVGKVQRGALAARLRRLRRVVRAADAQHAAFDQADRGRDRVGARDRCGVDRPVPMPRPHRGRGRGRMAPAARSALSTAFGAIFVLAIALGARIALAMAPASPRHIESESAEHDLHCFHAMRRMDEILIANFMVFHDVARDERYDLWIADEGWEIDYYLHENPRREARPLRVADRLRGLAADARRRRRRGGADRRLQRRDGRAHRAQPRACATARCSSATPTTSWRTGSVPTCR